MSARQLLLFLLVSLLIFAAGAQARNTGPRIWIALDYSYDLSSPSGRQQAAAALARHGFKPRHASRWLNAFSGFAPADSLPALRRLPGVVSITPVSVYHHSGVRNTVASRAKLAAFDSGFGLSRPALSLMGVPALLADTANRLSTSIAGGNVRIAFLGSGFNLTHEVFSHFTDSSILAKRDYVAGMVDTGIRFDTTLQDDSLDFPGQEDKGTSEFSVLAGFKPGVFMGVAPFARFALLKTERVTDTSGNRFESSVEEDAWIAAVEWAVDSVKVDILVSPFGFRFGFTDTARDSAAIPFSQLTGDSLPITRTANLAASKGVLVFAAIGNDGDSGWRSLSAPSDGDSVIAMGATDTLGCIASFTSYGPTSKGRSKPDLSAPGSGIYAAQASGGYQHQSGTGYATALAAGACALLLQLEDSLKGRPDAVRSLLRQFSFLPKPASGLPDTRFGAGIINVYGAHSRKIVPPVQIPYGRVWVYFSSPANMSDPVSLAQTMSQLSPFGFRKKYVSRWLNAVSGNIHADSLALIRSLPSVKRVDQVNTFRRTLPLPQFPAMAKTKTDTAFYGNSSAALQLMGVPRTFEAGLLSRDSAGKGIRIALLDAGFNIRHACFSHFNDSTIIAKRDYVVGMIDSTNSFDTTVQDDSVNGHGQQNHGTNVLSLIAARAPGTMMGVAPYARFALLKTERTDIAPNGMEYETVDEEDAWIAAIEWAVDSVGVDIVTSSLGYRNLFSDGRSDYTVSMLNGDSLPITRVADSAARKGVPVFIAVGNDGREGSSTLGAPADGKNVIAVGSTDVSGMASVFTSTGPTGDNRPKPDLSAPGEGVFVAEASGGYSFGQGTSFATPLAAGVCALLMQADNSLKGKTDSVTRRLMDYAWFPQEIPTATRTDARYGAGIINLYGALLRKSLTQPYRGTDFWIAGQPVRAGNARFVLQLSGVSLNDLKTSSFSLKIYTLSGTLVKSLSLGWPTLKNGRNEIVWSTANEAGKRMAPGIYLVSARYSSEIESRSYRQKLALIP